MRPLRGARWRRLSWRREPQAGGPSPFEKFPPSPLIPWTTAALSAPPSTTSTSHLTAANPGGPWRARASIRAIISPPWQSGARMFLSGPRPTVFMRPQEAPSLRSTAACPLNPIHQRCAFMTKYRHCASLLQAAGTPVSLQAGGCTHRPGAKPGRKSTFPRTQTASAAYTALPAGARLLLLPATKTSILWIPRAWPQPPSAFLDRPLPEGTLRAPAA